MKLMQILNGVCHYDMTPLGYTDVGDAKSHYAPDIEIVEAPNNVFEGWGYDNTASGDARFTAPVPPDGWGYDVTTGTFYPTDPEIIEAMKTPEQKRIEELEADNAAYQAALAELGVTV